MPYTPQTWVDSPSTTTPITAARLAYIETGVQTAQGTAEAADGGDGVNILAYGAIPNDSSGAAITANNTAFTNAAATGNMVKIPDGTWWVTLNLDQAAPRWRGNGYGSTKVQIAAGQYFIDSNQQWDNVDISGIDFVGGAGAIRNRYTSSNVTWTHEVRYCRFRDYTAVAISHNSSDMNCWKIHHNVFRAVNDTATIGVALPGLTDLSEISHNAWHRNKIHVKLGNGGNNAKVESNDFVQYTSAVGGNLRANIWVVPRTSSTNAGSGFHAANNKHGNENHGVDDRRILYADEGAGTHFGDRLPNIGADSTGFIIGHTITDENISGGVAAPIVYTTTPNVRGSSFRDLKISGTSPTYVIQYRTPTADPAVDNSSNEIGPILENDNNFTPFAVSNQQYVGAVTDLQGVMHRPGRPMKERGGARSSGYSNLVTNKINSFTLEGAATKSAIADSIGGTDAAEVTMPSGIYNSFTPTTDKPIWIEFDLKQGATSPATEIYMQVGLSGAANGNHFRRRYFPDASWRTYREQIVSASSAAQLIKFKLTAEATGTKVQIGRVRVYHAYEPVLTELELPFAATTTSAPSAGGAGALPATPLGYLTVYINGSPRQIAYY